MRFRTAFFGTPEFSLPVAEALWTVPEAELVLVVTSPDKPQGRGGELIPPPVKSWAEEHGIAVMQPGILDCEFAETLQAIRLSFGVIASYGKILPQAVLRAFERGVLNIHPSLLPKWRGPSPVQSAIAAGDKETGVTIILTDEEMDHGPILAQRSYVMRGDETAGALRKELFALGGALLKETLPAWLQGEVEAMPQDHKQATVSRKLAKEDGRIDWRRPAEELARLVRAYDPWPGTFTEVKGKRLKVLSASVVQHAGETEPGTVAEDAHGYLTVRTGDGWLRLTVVQPEGKQPMDGKAFLQGRPDLLGQRLH